MIKQNIINDEQARKAEQWITPDVDILPISETKGGWGEQPNEAGAMDWPEDFRLQAFKNS